MSLCIVLRSSCCAWQCFGSVHDDLDDSGFHVSPGTRSLVAESVSLEELLEAQSPFEFHLNWRLKVAAMLSMAHLRYERTDWIQNSWEPQHVLFPKISASEFDHTAPCIISQFASIAGAPPTVQDADFCKLGILLLELAFGRRLETHKMWNDPNHPGRNPSDPIMRKGVAEEWAKDVRHAVPKEGFAHAVEWCLHQAPQPGAGAQWRTDFANNVAEPLRAYE